MTSGKIFYLLIKEVTGQTPESYVASDFDLPLDFKSQADAYGVEGIRVETPDELTAQIRRGCELNKPLVIDAVIDGTV